MTALPACGSCGTGLRDSARFCDECGVPTAVAADTTEYKQVTVLFADVVHSMEIAASVDAERMREIMNELVERSADLVQRYGGTVEYTGDGVMGLFGAPIALEDHAFRGCLAALAIQEETHRMAAQVQRRDGVDLLVRVGLNSGQVIAGEIGSGSLGYRATGHSVGLAQRMESVAPPGGVMLSESTARLVAHRTELAESEWIQVKGADQPIRAHRLLAISPRAGIVGRAEASLVGRRWEMAALDALVERTVGGRGGAVNLVGPPGIGKSRVAREASALATAHGVEVIWAFCESHASDIPFGVMTGLLRAANGIVDLDGPAARARVREQLRDAETEDLLLLDDLLGIADPDVPLPQVNPDVRRRRLTALINTASLARTEPALYIVEDAHWIDAVSESMLADFLRVVPRTPSMVLITSRPEYQGVLIQVHGAQAITLAPLLDSDSAALLTELLGSHPSVAELAAIIADRAAGNPFFAEEMVRELVQRGVLTGEHGDYVCRADVAEVSVPATVQAAIKARIDRLSTPAKQTLYAASVIGARFGAGLLSALEIDPVSAELLGAELIDQVRFTPDAEYAFHHPLIRAVAYESQLKSGRSEWHRRLAAAIREREPDSVEENAALIAEHLQAAGDLHAAFGWHMRAGARSISRDPGAARVSWERARLIADSLPGPNSEQNPEHLSMRIAPRTMLCATGGLGGAVHEGQRRFDELRELCTATGDNVSLAIGMTGLATEFMYAGRSDEGSRLASEQMELLETIGDPTLIMGLAFVAFCNWFDAGHFGNILRWSQTVVDLADGDPAKGAGFGFESPLASALAWRGTARWWQGLPGWRRDLDEAVAMARSRTPDTLAVITAWAYGTAIQNGVLRADESVLRVIEETVRAAAASSVIPVSLARYTKGLALLNRDTAADRHDGLDLMVQARGIFVQQRALFLMPVADSWIAREKARSGDLDGAIPVMRAAVSELLEAGRLGYGVFATGILVDTLLERGAEGDLAEANEITERLAKLLADGDSAIREITLLRLRALLSRASGDADARCDSLRRYHTTAKSLGFEGHLDWAEAMIEGR